MAKILSKGQVLSILASNGQEAIYLPNGGWSGVVFTPSTPAPQNGSEAPDSKSGYTPCFGGGGVVWVKGKRRTFRRLRQMKEEFIREGNSDKLFRNRDPEGFYEYYKI